MEEKVNIYIKTGFFFLILCFFNASNLEAAAKQDMDDIAKKKSDLEQKYYGIQIYLKKYY